eukprot:Partr_v1_DN27834_c0_g1_i2_m22652 putative Lipase (class 3)
MKAHSDSSDGQRIVTTSTLPSAALISPQLLMPGGEQAGFLLPSPIAASVSSLSRLARFSVKTTHFMSQLLFDSAKSSTSLCLNVSRETLLRSISIMESLHRSTSSILSGSSSSSTSASSSLRTNAVQYSDDTSVYLSLLRFLVSQSFGAAEYLGASGLDTLAHLSSVSLKTVDEAIHLFDGVFGANDTSRSVAAFMTLFKHELLTDNDEFPSLAQLGFPKLIKAFLAYSYVQTVNRDKLLLNIPHRVLLKITVTPEAGISVRHSINVDEQIRLLFDGEGGISERWSPSSTMLDDSFNAKIQWDSGSHRVSRSASVASFASMMNENHLKPFHQSMAHVLQNLSHLSKFSSAMYGRRFLQILNIANYPCPPVVSFDSLGRRHPENHVIFSLHAGVPLETIIGSSFKERELLAHVSLPQLHVPEYIITIDSDRKLIVATLRGTFGLSDLLTSLTCESASIAINDDNFDVHSGMLVQAKCLASPGHHFHSTIKQALIENRNYGLVLTGHSLGGGVASLIGLLWSNLGLENSRQSELPSFWTSRESGLPSFRPLHVYVFGSPCVMSAELSYAVRGLVTSLVHGYDFIARLSLGGVRDLKRIAWILAGDNTPASDEIINQALSDFQNASDKKQKAEIQCAKAGTILYDRDATNTEQFDSALCQNKEDTVLPPATPAKDKDWFWSIHTALLASSSSDKHYPPGDVYWMHLEELESIVTESPPNHLQRSQTDDTFFSKRESMTIPTLNRFEIPSKVAGPHPSLSTTVKMEGASILQLVHIQDIESMFVELQFSNSMILDHSPGRYEWSLKALEAATRL